jgi:hypothetical protein
MKRRLFCQLLFAVAGLANSSGLFAECGPVIFVDHNRGIPADSRPLIS